MKSEDIGGKIKPRSIDEFMTPSCSLMDLAKDLEMDPWIINDMLNNDEINSSCSSALSDRTDRPSTNFDQGVCTIRDFNKIIIPQDRVIKLINALASDPKALLKPHNKTRDS